MATTTTRVSEQTSEQNAVRPFQVKCSGSGTHRIAQARQRDQVAERETVSDATQGVQLATMQALARYWATEYDWRKIEARLNALPQFITEIDALDIHFIHVRSKHNLACF